MSRHRMPPGANSGKETTEMSDDNGVRQELTKQLTEESVENADEPIESADEPTESADQPAESVEESSEDVAEDPETAVAKRRVDWSRIVAYGVLPAIVLLLAMATGYLKWQDNSARDTDITDVDSPAAQSVRVAKDSTIAMLSYQPDTVEQQLTAARDLLTGEFRDSYTSLINDVVIPGAKQKQISAVASVPAVASVSSDPRHAVVLVFVNQTVVISQDAPTDTASSVRVTMEKVGDRWLIAKFDPV